MQLNMAMYQRNVSNGMAKAVKISGSHNGEIMNKKIMAKIRREMK
jgi:hypothetical protein